MNLHSSTTTTSPRESLIQFTNCRLVQDHALQQKDLWICNGKIVDPMKIFYDERRRADQRIDCEGAIISAGFIDIQINGGFGADFTHDVDTVAKGINKVACEIIKRGVTSFCPTLITSSAETYKKIIPKIPKKTEGAGILGLHLEGPFMNVLKKGAHPEEFIKNFKNGFESLQSTYGCLDNVKIVTLAPELEKSNEVIRELAKLGVVVSLGHSNASLEQGEDGIRNGATLITHLFNAMPPFHHREPGLAGLISSNVQSAKGQIWFGIICDKVHTHPVAVKIAYYANPNGLILVTDAISALGLEDGDHYLGTQAIRIQDKKAIIAGTETLCGSIIHMDECVRNFRKATNCSIVEAVECATLHPALCLGIEKSKGTLDFGSDADLVFLDDELNIVSTWIDGRCAFVMAPWSCDTEPRLNLNGRS